MRLSPQYRCGASAQPNRDARWLADLRKRQQCDMPCALQGHRQRALVARACPGHPARQDLAPLRQVPAQPGDLLVVDEVDVLQAEAAHLAAAAVEIRHGSPAQNGMSSGSTSPPAGTVTGTAPPASPEGAPS